MVGYSTDEKQRPLLPICHMTAQSHIEIIIDAEGNFRNARLITEKTDATTIIPCTESSASRAGKKPECHPLCDSLQYVAGDFVKYGGDVTSGFAKDPEEPHREFIKVLTDWSESEFAHAKAQAVLKYVKQKTVIKDLVKHQILLVGKDEKLLAKREKKKEKNAVDIFSVAGSQDKSFIRWQVEVPGNPETKVWKDKTLWESWGKYYLSTKKKEPICFVTGENALLSLQHPKYIRAPGDGAKLISSNDTSGFTFRGRFLTAEQACGVSFEVSQKAHNTLIWLISRQGYRKGDQAIVAWATSGSDIPKPTDDAVSILGEDDLLSDESPITSTAQELAIKLRKGIAGYGKKLGDTTGVVVMGLDSATPGRMAITYYRELTGSDFLQRIENWHESCAWIHNYRYIEVQENESNKKKRKYIPFVGAPTPSDIAEAAYGSKVDDKLRKATVERILPCIIDGQQIPRDLVESAVRRASNRIGMESWEWNKTISIACALYKNYNRKEKYDMALDLNRKTRDYLYGRLLAIADRLEEHALYKAEEKRATNAARYMQRFASRPNKTWLQIYLSLSPYIVKLGGAKYYKDLIDEVKLKFDPIEDFNSDKPLSGEFLLAYHCQRAALWKKEDEESSGKQLNNDETNNNQ
jgi:CRISPR-associated protein Csd1